MNPEYDFTWKGESAHDVYGVETMEIGSTVIAERRDNTYTVAGRSGLVHDQDGAVEEVERRLTIYLPYEQGGTVAAFGEIRKWLKGYGKLTLSTIPDRHMMAYITDQIALDPILEGFADRKGSVIFRCEPYLYHSNVEAITLTSGAAPEFSIQPSAVSGEAGNLESQRDSNLGGVLNNPGTAESRPVITVNATGDLNLMIGTQTILLRGLTGKIVIDSTIEEAYGHDENGRLINLNSRMGGDFPVLPCGAVPVSWSLNADAEDGTVGALTSVEIQPNWRDEN